jgi:predicted alpha-1,2-mannosidase
MKSNNVCYFKGLVFVFILLLCGFCEKGHTTEFENLSPVNLVYPQLDTENSRWFFFSSACRPFGMVNLSPDTEVDGAWGSGYRYKSTTVHGFSHIHAWQLSGLSVMPVVISETDKKDIFKDFSSSFSHETEKVAPGYHYIELDRYSITAELTSTKRVGFHKYAFPENSEAAILFNLNGKLGPCKIVDGTLEKIGPKELSGSLVNAPTRRRPKPTKVFFHIEFNTEIEAIEKEDKSGNYLVFVKKSSNYILIKAAISYTSTGNAKVNLESELAHWDFDKVVSDSKAEWNDMLSRLIIDGGTETDQRRFYTDLWHALQGRRIISDVNGAYPDNTGDTFRIGQLPLDENEEPRFNHYNSDSFWGAQWTLNTLWGLVYPDIMEEFVHSLMQYYDDGGMIPRGPSGGNYTYVMTGASSTPFIVSAIQKGIITKNLNDIYAALKKNHMPGGIMEKAGYEHKTTLGGGLLYYIKDGYVPYPIPEGRFGLHQDGPSLTMEYAYQDWTLAQLAKKMNLVDDYKNFMRRSLNYKNVYDKSSGWMRPKNAAGEWKQDYDPYQYTHGFNESNGAQSTWFVPHDIGGLAELMGGKVEAVKKLHAQFETAQAIGFTSGNSHDLESHPEYRRIPINYGNQPSIQTAFVFHYLNRPDLTHYWSRKVVDTAFSGLTPATGYNGDEDQGLMGSLAVLMKIGLFQMNGGTEENPVYEISSPIFDKVTIKLNPDYYSGDTFVITSTNNSPDHHYIKNAVLNNARLQGNAIHHDDIVKGGELVLKMTDEYTDQSQ